MDYINLTLVNVVSSLDGYSFRLNLEIDAVKYEGCGDCGSINWKKKHIVQIAQG